MSSPDLGRKRLGDLAAGQRGRSQGMNRQRFVDRDRQQPVPIRMENNPSHGAAGRDKHLIGRERGQIPHANRVVLTPGDQRMPDWLAASE